MSAKPSTAEPAANRAGAKTEPEEPVDITEDLYALVHYLHVDCHQDLLDAIAREQLSFSQLQLLERLRRGGYHPTIRQAAALMHISVGAASRGVEALAQRGLVRREGHERDERAKRVVITDRGAEVITRLHAARLDGVAAVNESLTDPERRQLRKALEPLRERTDPYRPKPPPA